MNTKTIIIILNVLGVLCAIGWMLHLFTRSYGAAFGSASGTSGFWGTVPSWLSGSVLIVSIISIVLSHMDHSKRALLWAALPMISLLPAFLCLNKLRYNYNKQRNQAYAKQVEGIDAALSVFPRDYTGVKQHHSEVKDSFIIHDRDHHVLVLVFGRYTDFEVVPLGKIKGTTLEVYNPEVVKKSYYSDWRDSKGKSIYDNYTVVYKSKQNEADYHLEKYEVKK